MSRVADELRSYLVDLAAKHKLMSQYEKDADPNVKILVGSALLDAECIVAALQACLFRVGSRGD